MPKISSTPLQASETGERVVVQRRLDGPHEPARWLPEDDWPETPVHRELLIGAEEPAAPLEVQQLEQHAEQLAEYLRDQHSELDRREAQLNARTAQWEQEQRASRLQIEERRHDLDERELQIARREEDLKRRQQALIASEVSFEQAAAATEHRNQSRAADLEGWAQRLQQREQQADELQQRLSERERQAALSQQKWQQQLAVDHQQLQSKRAELQAFQRQMLAQLAEHRAALEQQLGRPSPPPLATPAATREHTLAELNRRLRDHEQERELWIAERDLQRHELEQWSAQQRAAIAGEKQRLREQRETMHRMYTWLAGARQDALRIHGQTLEMRLATEQVWGNLISIADPGKLIRTLDQLRGQIADHYHAQRSEAEQLLVRTQQAAQKLEEKQCQFDQQRQKWQTWFAEQRQKLAAQTSHLAARQQQLDAQVSRQRRLQLELHVRGASPVVEKPLKKRFETGFELELEAQKKAEPSRNSAPLQAFI